MIQYKNKNKNAHLQQSINQPHKLVNTNRNTQAKKSENLNKNV